MNHAIHYESRIIMIGNLCGLTASALVYCHVHDHAARFHMFQIFFLHQLRCRLTRNQYTADHKICIGNCCFHSRIGTYQRLDPCTKNIVQICQSLQIDIHDRYICAHADCNLACIGSNRTCAEDNNLRLRSSRNTT